MKDLTDELHNYLYYLDRETIKRGFKSTLQERLGRYKIKLNVINDKFCNINNLNEIIKSHLLVHDDYINSLPKCEPQVIIENNYIKAKYKNEFIPDSKKILDSKGYTVLDAHGNEFLLGYNDLYIPVCVNKSKFSGKKCQKNSL